MMTRGHESRLYPFMVSLARRRVLVVGGGPVAERKVDGLLDAGGRPVVVAPRITDKLALMVQAGRVRWWRRRFRDEDLRGVRVAFACTADAVVNTSVTRAGRRRGILVVDVSRPRGGGVAGSALLRRGPLTVAISTDGAVPGMAALIRQCLEEIVPARWGRAVVLARRARRRLQQLAPTSEIFRECWRSLRNSGVLLRLLDGDESGFEEEVKRCTSRFSV